jgi:hypothetical protein
MSSSARSSVVSKAWTAVIAMALLTATQRAESLKIPPADMSSWALQAPADVAVQFDVPIHGTLNPNVYTSRIVTTPDVTYPVQYIIGDLHERYVKAAIAALFRQSTFASGNAAGPAGVATLRLIAVSNTHYVGKGFATRDITDQIVAQWGLFDLSGQLIYPFTFSGSAVSYSGLGKAYSARGRERTGRAHQDLLDNTARAFAASAQLKRFNLIAPLYLDAAQRLANADALIKASTDAGRAAIFDAVRWLAAERGDPALYRLVRSAIETQQLAALIDDSPLLHTAIKSGNEPLLSAIIANSRNLEVLEDGWTPLYRLMLREEHGRAVALVSAGATPVVEAAEQPFVAAEFNYKLATLLGATPGKAKLAFAAARTNYTAAVAEARRDIQKNENEIWATRWANILAPALLVAQASAIASAQASAGALQTGFIGFGSSVYTPKRFDANTPKATIIALEDLMRHCEQRLASIPE